MSVARKILREALALPEPERRVLVEALSDSLDSAPVDLSPEWRQEVEDRIAQIERGEAETVPWEDVEQRIRRTLGRG